MDDRRTDIWIARHGETDWSRRGLHTGRTDAPLTAAGEREAIALRRRFGGRRFALVLSSPRLGGAAEMKKEQSPAILRILRML